MLKNRKAVFVLQLVGLGWYIAFAILVGVVGGLWLDSKLGTKVVFTLTGIIAGSTLAFYGVYRMVLSLLGTENNSHKAVVWVCGARGGFGGPGPGTYLRLVGTFQNQGVTSLRLDYRDPNNLRECVLDLITGIN